MLRHFLVSFVMWCAIASQSLAECRDDAVSLRGDWGQARFRVEVAADEDSRALGLMNRPQMSSGAGMLFIYPTEQPVAFWMKNTLIPLDMIFVKANGQVAHIHHNAIPLDLTAIPSRTPVRYVLEINGGMAANLGLSVGSLMQHPTIDKKNSLWPCKE